MTTITKDQFNDAISVFEPDYIACIQEALEAAQYEKDEIHEVVMVGGSTRTPIVR